MGTSGELTSRERLLRCIRHEPLDRTPASAYYIDPYDETTYRNHEPRYLEYVEICKQYDDTFTPAGIGGQGIYWSASDKVRAWSEEEREGPIHRITSYIETPQGVLQSRHRWDDGIATTWQLEPLLKGPEDEARLLSMPFEPPELDFSDYERKTANIGQRGIVQVGIPDPICMVYPAMGWKGFSMAALERPGEVLRLLDFFAERLEWLAEQIAAHCHETSVRIAGPEYVGPGLASPDLFRRYCLQYDRRLVEIIRRSDNFACIHCHGPLGGIVDMIGAMEPHILEPIEPPPDGDVPLTELKRRLGERICLMGYIEFRHLEYDEPEVLERRVAEACRDGGDTGYVLLATDGPIQAPSRRCVENHRVFFEAARKYGER